MEKSEIKIAISFLLLLIFTSCSPVEPQGHVEILPSQVIVSNQDHEPTIFNSKTTSQPIITPTGIPKLHETTLTPSLTPTVTCTATIPLTATATSPITCHHSDGFEWSRIFMRDTAYITNIFSLDDGCVLISGFVDSSNGIWVAKIDPEGNPIWQKLFSVSQGEMIAAPNGNYLIRYNEGAIEINSDGEVVQSASLTNMIPNTDGSITVLDGTSAMRYVDNNAPLWAYSINNSGIYGKLTSDGGVIYAYSGEYVDKSVYWMPVYSDIKVISIDAVGTVRQRVYGKLIGYETLDGLQVTDDGGALLFGTHYYEELGLDYDIWLMKVNKSGGISWQTTLRLPETLENVDSLHKLPQGYLIINNDYITNNVRLIKLAANGTLSWQKEINSIRGTIIIDTAAGTQDGGIILSGHTAEKTGVRFLARFDNRGNLLWEKLIGFSGLNNTTNSTVNTILPMINGNILLGGSTNLLGHELADSYDAWLANIKDEGELLGFLITYPGKFSIIKTLSTRPNTLPDEVVEADTIQVRQINPQIEETFYQALLACLSAGVTLPTPEALPTLVPSLTPTPSFIRDLYLKSPSYIRGDDVLILQLRLLELRYNQVGTADGVFGKMTEDAVRLFQEKNNLAVDGFVGPLTWNELFNPAAQPND